MDEDDQRFALLVADIYELAGSLRRQGDEIAGAFGQSQARWQVLSVASEGTWTVPGIAQRLGISRQAVQRVVDDLVDDGLAALVANPAHRRSPHVALTAPGRRTLAAITAAARSWHRQIAGELSDTRLHRLHGDLRAVLDVVNHLDDS
jgi:DNA-binding MarR family transcriptional regulator